MKNKKYLGNVESFSLDHTKVVAPYVRLVTIYTGPKGDKVSKFDIRFTQPNKDYLSIEGIHSLEHLMAEFIRDEISGVIDLSPMGCRTGFYLTIFGEFSEEDIAKAMINVLEKISNWDNSKPIPGVDPVMCGNWEGHNLDDAKSWAKTWVSKIKKKGHKAFPL